MWRNHRRVTPRESENLRLLFSYTTRNRRRIVRSGRISSVISSEINYDVPYALLTLDTAGAPGPGSNKFFVQSNENSRTELWIFNARSWMEFLEIFLNLNHGQVAIMWRIHAPRRCGGGMFPMCNYDSRTRKNFHFIWLPELGHQSRMSRLLVVTHCRVVTLIAHLSSRVGSSSWEKESSELSFD